MRCLVFKIWCIFSNFRNENFKDFPYPLDFARSAKLPPPPQKKKKFLPSYGTVLAPSKVEKRTFLSMVNHFLLQRSAQTKTFATRSKTLLRDKYYLCCMITSFFFTICGVFPSLIASQYCNLFICKQIYVPCQNWWEI